MGMGMGIRIEKKNSNCRVLTILVYIAQLRKFHILPRGKKGCGSVEWGGRKGVAGWNGEVGRGVAGWNGNGTPTRGKNQKREGCGTHPDRASFMRLKYGCCETRTQQVGR